MSPVEALKAARAAGVGIAVDGDDLVLQALAPPPAAVLAAFSRHKADIIAILRAANDGWTDQECQGFHHEPAGVTPGRIPGTSEAKDILWPEGKAAALNRLFQEQGVTGEPGRITAATVRHGERRTSEPTGVTRQSVRRPARAGLGGRE